jgi:hypothetical protein
MLKRFFFMFNHAQAMRGSQQVNQPSEHVCRFKRNSRRKAVEKSVQSGNRSLLPGSSAPFELE